MALHVTSSTPSLQSISAPVKRGAQTPIPQNYTSRTPRTAVATPVTSAKVCVKHNDTERYLFIDASFKSNEDIILKVFNLFHDMVNPKEYGPCYQFNSSRAFIPIWGNNIEYLKRTDFLTFFKVECSSSYKEMWDIFVKHHPILTAPSPAVISPPSEPKGTRLPIPNPSSIPSPSPVASSLVPVDPMVKALTEEYLGRKELNVTLKRALAKLSLDPSIASSKDVEVQEVLEQDPTILTEMNEALKRDNSALKAALIKATPIQDGRMRVYCYNHNKLLGIDLEATIEDVIILQMFKLFPEIDPTQHIPSFLVDSLQFTSAYILPAEKRTYMQNIKATTLLTFSPQEHMDRKVYEEIWLPFLREHGLIPPHRKTLAESKSSESGTTAAGTI